MRFDSLFDLKYFLTGVRGSIVDSDLLLRVKGASGYEIPDADYYLLTDSVGSYVGEMLHYSGKKEYFRTLAKHEVLDMGHLHCLYACMTHLSLGLQGRRKARSHVDDAPYRELRAMVDGMVDGILGEGKADNVLHGLLGTQKGNQ
jgi:hypothetical protein